MAAEEEEEVAVPPKLNKREEKGFHGLKKSIGFFSFLLLLASFFLSIYLKDLTFTHVSLFLFYKGCSFWVWTSLGKEIGEAFQGTL